MERSAETNRPRLVGRSDPTPEGAIKKGREESSGKWHGSAADKTGAEETVLSSGVRREAAEPPAADGGDGGTREPAGSTVKAAARGSCGEAGAKGKGGRGDEAAAKSERRWAAPSEPPPRSGEEAIEAEEC